MNNSFVTIGDFSTTTPTGQLRWNQTTGKLEQEWFTHGNRGLRRFSESTWKEVPWVTPESAAAPLSPEQP